MSAYGMDLRSAVDLTALRPWSEAVHAYKKKTGAILAATPCENDCLAMALDFLVSMHDNADPISALHRWSSDQLEHIDNM